MMTMIMKKSGGGWWMKVEEGIGVSQFKGLVELGIINQVFSLSRVNISSFNSLLLDFHALHSRRHRSISNSSPENL
ncbi:hypothetical protein LWI29_031279 [Acer saccharum]|uniref:Uncharacterized protein n=1 Tax=Acer saccharum TaxID=4024 RepID=A0AA39VS91_ACESA|nr:hypothetical protein LWI29_031279 [Acer saccharum]